MTRLTIVVPSLGLGGAERVAVTLANEWMPRWPPGPGHHLLREISRSLRPRRAATRVEIDLVAPRRGQISRVMTALRRMRELRRAVVGFRTDVVVSVMDVMNVQAVVSLAGPQRP